jgi:hypothetical protein
VNDPISWSWQVPSSELEAEMQSRAAAVASPAAPMAGIAALLRRLVGRGTWDDDRNAFGARFAVLNLIGAALAPQPKLPEKPGSPPPTIYQAPEQET